MRSNSKSKACELYQNLRDEIPRKKLGGRTRARTWDPLIKSQLLYQLSYAPTKEGRDIAKPNPFVDNCAPRLAGIFLL